MAGRPPKPYAVLQSEGKSHRTKAEMEMREQGEKALLTGERLQESPEVEADPLAHARFVRLSGLLEKINHHDAVYETTVNRYCLMLAEVERHEKERAELNEELAKMREAYDAQEMDADSYFDRFHRLVDKRLRIDVGIDRKRSMLLAIEKEMAMTVAAALRCVPRREIEGDGEEDVMAKLLSMRGGASV